MPKKKRKAVPSDHLSKALEALRECPQPRLGLESDDKILPLGYVAGIGTESKDGSEATRKRKRSGKMRMAFNLPEALCERARNAVWHLSDRICLNLSSLTEGTLEREVTRLEKKYNDGKSFPKRQGRLKGGPLRRPDRRVQRSGRSTRRSHSRSMQPREAKDRESTSVR